MPVVSPKMRRAATPRGHLGHGSDLRGGRGDRLARHLELALGDLLEGHRQEVLRARLDQRRREALEAALAELVVVVVDLAGALGGGDHERVLAVDVFQQGVDLGVDHAVSSAVSRRIRSASSAAARSTWSFTIVWSNRSFWVISVRAIS